MIQHNSSHFYIIFLCYDDESHHLPENHPDKPKDDWLSSTIARVTASVATELATSLGYELSVVVSTNYFVNFKKICVFVIF